MKLNELSTGSKFRVDLGDKITKNVYVLENSSGSLSLYYHCSDSDGSIIFLSSNTDVIPVLVAIGSLKIGDRFIFDHTFDSSLDQQSVVFIDDIGHYKMYCTHPVSRAIVAIERNKMVRLPPAKTPSKE
jgi:hypothetical protein